MIRATVTYECGGCPAAVTTESIPMRATWESAFGGPLVRVLTLPKLDPTEHTPDGWTAFDPYTNCTYCPACWKAIEEGDESRWNTVEVIA
jgi:hypothetical protein